MGKADLHIHTTHSFDGTATVAATLEHVVRCTSLDLVAITDHDAIDGALLAVDLAPRYGIHVVPGIEISTAEGHLLALYVTRLIPRGLSLARTLDLVGEQGATTPDSSLASACGRQGWPSGRRPNPVARSRCAALQQQRDRERCETDWAPPT